MSNPTVGGWETWHYIVLVFAELGAFLLGVFGTLAKVRKEFISKDACTAIRHDCDENRCNLREAQTKQLTENGEALKKIEQTIGDVRVQMAEISTDLKHVLSKK